MSRTKKFLYNSSTSALQQIVTMIVGLITPRIMLTCYGSEINGLVSSITQFISYFVLVEAGLSNAAVYALYKPLADKDHGAINGVVTAAKWFYTISGYIFVALTMSLALLYPLYIKSDVLNPVEIGILVLILGTSGTLDFFTLSKYRALLTADQKTYVISLATILHTIVNTIIICSFALLGANIVWTRFIALFSIFMRSIILMVYCRRNYKFLDYKVEPNKAALNKRWDALLLQILGVVHTGAPAVIITLMLKDLKLVSVYSVFNMVLVGIGGVLSVFTSGVAASFGEVIARKEGETLKKSYREFECMYYLMITVVYSIAFVMIMPFINIYTNDVTDINYNMPILGFLFVLNGLLYNLKTPQGMLVISAGHYKETKMQTITQALIAVIGGIALAPFLGIYGIMIASILSNLYRDIDLLFYIPKNVTKTEVSGTFWRMVRVFVCAALSLIPFLFIKYEPTTLISWALYAIPVGIYVLSVTMLITYIFDKAELKNVIKRIKRLVIKNG